jgi:flagellum-specific ATP synthase
MRQAANWDLSDLKNRLKQAGSSQNTGTVHQVRGLVIEANGPNLAIGDTCRIETRGDQASVFAEVVGFREHKMLLMPFGDINQLGPGSRVHAVAHAGAIPCGSGLLGRILNGLGEPLDQGGALEYDYERSLRARPPAVLQRTPIQDVFQTGVRALDTFTPIGRGQRVGLFAGSGVGKSTLLGMLARGGDADVNVVALIGERGREVREFIENSLSAEALQRTVLIVSTSDEPAMVRLRAAYLATSIAESFRDAGQNVLFMMDSVTRFAMAQREIGLSVGEPPASRGYPPSVFSLLPQLLERTGNGSSGSITAFYTVLVEGDDMNEPIADSVRGILDGHIVLSRKMATANIFPAIDVLESISRLATTIYSDEVLGIVSQARELLAVYRENEDLINIGAYVPKSSAAIDRAIEKRASLVQFLRQGMRELTPSAASFEKLKEIVK